MTRPYAEVIGDPIAHSKSPLIHGFWLNALGIDAEYRATRVTAAALPGYFADRRGDAAWRGCNVTMPHKITAAAIADRHDRIAEIVRAANTIIPNREGLLLAHNTDVAGIREPLERVENRIEDYPNHVATYVQIIGAGGAGRAAAFAACEAGLGDLEFYNRDRTKAMHLAEDFGLPEWYGQELAGIGPIRNENDVPAEQRYSHIVINATAMGMDGKPAVPIHLKDYYSDTIVFDMVYSPLDTPLLREAREYGLRTIDGLAMLIGQAAKAFELFFGEIPPRDRDDELRVLLTR